MFYRVFFSTQLAFPSLIRPCSGPASPVFFKRNGPSATTSSIDFISPGKWVSHCAWVKVRLCWVASDGRCSCLISADSPCVVLGVSRFAKYQQRKTANSPQMASRLCREAMAWALETRMYGCKLYSLDYSSFLYHLLHILSSMYGIPIAAFGTC